MKVLWVRSLAMQSWAFCSGIRQDSLHLLSQRKKCLSGMLPQNLINTNTRVTISLSLPQEHGMIKGLNILLYSQLLPTLKKRGIYWVCISSSRLDVPGSQFRILPTPVRNKERACLGNSHSSECLMWCSQMSAVCSHLQVRWTGYSR